MTTNNVHVLAGNKPAPRILLADRDPTESAIAIRAIERHWASLEVWSVATLADAADALARIETVLVGSGLDGKTLPQTIRWFARNAPGAAIVALLEQPDRDRQEALEAGASSVCSKPDRLITQLRHEFGARWSTRVQEPSRRIG